MDAPHDRAQWGKNQTGVPCVCLALFWASQLFGADWPQWRGPNRDAAWAESGIVEKLPSTGLKVLWRAPIAMGFSSPVIVDGKVYLSDAEVKKPIVRQRVHCLAADPGKARWTYAYDTSAPDWFFTDDQARGPGATPIVRKGKIYALDLFGSLVCLDTVHGKLVWKRNLKEEFQMPGTSVDTSPLIEGDLLILLLGGKGGAGVVALDRSTGREVWRSLEEALTWSSPIVIKAGGVRQLIVWTQQSVSSLNPANGRVYCRCKTRGEIPRRQGSQRRDSGQQVTIRILFLWRRRIQDGSVGDVGVAVSGNLAFLVQTSWQELVG